MTSAEAQRVVDRASVLDALRACAEVPGTVIAEVDIARGRGEVATLNRHAPQTSVQWHGCVRPVLEALDFPSSEAAARVRVRLALRSR